MPTITYTRSTIMGTVQQSIVPGVLVHNYPDKDVSLVVTSSHLFSSGVDGDITVRFPRSGHKGKLVAFSAEHDVSVIAITRAASKHIFMSRSTANQGENVRMCTVGPFRMKRGRIVGQTTDGFIVDTPVATGWSGGPVVNMQGHLIGIISGAESRTYVTGVEGIRAVLCPYMSGQGTPPVETPVKPPFTEMPDIPVPDIPTPAQQPDRNLQLIMDRLEQIEAKLNQIETIAQVPGLPGLDGKDGVDGMPGKDGNSWRPSSDDLDDIAARVKIPKLKVAFGDGDGNVVSVAEVDLQNGGVLYIPGVKLHGVDSTGEIKSSAYAPLGSPVGIKANVLERAD